MRTRRRWVVAGVVAVPLAFAVVLAVEVELARRGPTLPETEPHDLDGLVGRADGGDPIHLVWLGDSTAAGVGASSRDGALPRQVAALLDRPVRVTGLAVSGARVGDVVEDQAGLADLDPDVVLVSVGANDVTHLGTLGAFEDQYRDLVAALPDGVDVVLLGVPDMGSIPRLAQPLRAIAGFRGRQLDEVVRDVAAEVGAAYVDIAGSTGPAFRADSDRYYAADDYHPDDDGYRLWAEAVVAVLADEVLPER